MKSGALLSYLAGLLLLSGCATPQGATNAPLVPVSAPCISAGVDAQAEPARTLTLDVSQPGLAVQLFAANRARWIGYADALKTKLDACK